MPHMISRQTCEVTVQSRIHVTLIGMNAGGYRRNGGIGFGVSEPSAVVEVTESQEFTVEDTRERPLDGKELDSLGRCLAQFSEVPMHVKISGGMPSHCGFGSSTAIRLATLESCARVSGADCTRQQLVRASGRGGTSGVGVNTYFDGGLVMDLGVNSKSGSPFAPSSWKEQTASPPLVLLQHPLPEWEVGICVPGDIRSLSSLEEMQFFQRTCPIHDKDVYETLYDVIYGMAASNLEAEFECFCSAIRKLQSNAWKSAERALYGNRIVELENVIYEGGAAAVGMSSLGPALFFLSDNCSQLVTKLSQDFPQHQWHSAKLSNSGRRIREP